jgi:hypothetical protein
VSGGAVHDLTDAECLTHPRDTAPMLSDGTPIGGWQGVLRSRGASPDP